ncbi:hypothetical protein GJ744_002363 [Endocarpon pusillum]|uniref:Uncharacterized protein n=1 Tax=Endocarpon pusillum TaxID=364733 RepID=A0A8H7E9Z5_9EURO|nr:hypothetical protein GJ744_002363 [Endocarpon pusillum]
MRARAREANGPQETARKEDPSVMASKKKKAGSSPHYELPLIPLRRPRSPQSHGAHYSVKVKSFVFVFEPSSHVPWWAKRKFGISKQPRSPSTLQNMKHQLAS